MGWVGVSGLTRKVLIKLSPMPEAVNEKWSRGQLARMIHIFCKIFALQDRAVCWRPKWYIDHPVRSKPKCLHFLLELEAQEHDMIKVHRTHLHAQTPSGHCQELLTLQRPPLQHSASLLACWVFLGRPRIKLRKSYRKTFLKPVENGINKVSMQWTFFSDWSPIVGYACHWGNSAPP